MVMKAIFAVLMGMMVCVGAFGATPDIVTPWEAGVVFVEPGFVVVDDFDLAIPATAVTVTGTVDVKTIGSYTLTYTFKNSKGWVMTASRRVDVRDTVGPVISPIGGTMWIQRGATFVDPGATAVDAYAGAVPVTASGVVDAMTAGKYAIRYDAKDPSGNAAMPMMRTVFVGNLPRIILK
jgi:hypothetical protein